MLLLVAVQACFIVLLRIAAVSSQCTHGEDRLVCCCFFVVFLPKKYKCKLAVTFRFSSGKLDVFERYCVNLISMGYFPKPCLLATIPYILGIYTVFVTFGIVTGKKV